MKDTGSIDIGVIFNKLKARGMWQLRKKSKLCVRDKKRRQRGKLMNHFEGVERYSGVDTPHRDYAFAPPMDDSSSE